MSKKYDAVYARIKQLKNRNEIWRDRKRKKKGLCKKKKKKTIKIWDVNFDNIVISKLVKGAL